MNIVFICSSLEPGRDGVGDYTRRLSITLINLGHRVTALALKDKFVTAETVCKQINNEEALDVIRIPFNWNSKKRMICAKHWIDRINPDWLSLQFVLFSFEDHGLPYNISNDLKNLGKGRRWHIMFHELWVGINNKKSIKYYLWGSAQQQIIKQLIFKLKPKVIHTHTKLYQAKLKQLGFAAEYLPIFGNIPFANSTLIDTEYPNIKTIKLVLFGTIHPIAILNEFIQSLLKYQIEFKATFTLTIIGRTGNLQEIWASSFKTWGILVNILGELAPADISKVLSNSTLGISTTPIEFSEKSGTIAAMREHGLMVLCIPAEITKHDSDNFISQAGIFNFYNGGLNTILKSIKKYSSNSTVEKVGLELSSVFCERLTN